jgi:hypothetical protein
MTHDVDRDVRFGAALLAEASAARFSGPERLLID